MREKCFRGREQLRPSEQTSRFMICWMETPTCSCRSPGRRLVPMIDATDHLSSRSILRRPLQPRTLLSSTWRQEGATTSRERSVFILRMAILPMAKWSHRLRPLHGPKNIRVRDPILQRFNGSRFKKTKSTSNKIMRIRNSTNCSSNYKTRTTFWKRKGAYWAKSTMSSCWEFKDSRKIKASVVQMAAPNVATNFRLTSSTAK